MAWASLSEAQGDNVDLVLWRHAEAEDGIDDLARALTPKGVRQARAMAKWLRRHLPQGTRVLVSPALRARQTAQALGWHWRDVAALAPGALVDQLLAAAGWPLAQGCVLVVGHQPTLGEVAAQLLGAAQGLNLRKGGILWFEHRLRDGAARTDLRAAVDAGLLD